MKDFNMRQLGSLLNIEDGQMKINYIAAGLAYLFMALVAVVFIQPHLSSQLSYLQYFLYGSLLGVCVYGIYDMTNMATLKGYTWAFAAADIAWGSFLYGIVFLVISWNHFRSA